ncbi:putative amidohydrolase [Coniochaeta sp. 2T2.1]|nr:putative amidohydrolase [Coniochaeta sp. 2T2.1]
MISVLKDHPLNLGEYEDQYKHFHSHPELSLHEKETSSTIASHRSLGAYKVHTSIGGYGVVAVLSNGDGPTVLLRADMDALPVEEKTGVDYASNATVKDEEGNTIPVMHACGHDMHVTCLLGAAGWLAREDVKKKWAGTLVLLFQPNEERGKGARAMVDDGLYDRVPEPDVVLAQHVMPMRAGKVAVKAGTMIASADSFKITVYGRGGHGSMPQLCIDPVVLAANIVIRLQGIVAREVDPQDAAVVTVGSLHAGSSDNIIADKAVLLVDVRTQKEETRQRTLKAIERIVRKECEVSNCENPPTFERTRQFPLTVNDADATQKVSAAFANHFGDAFDPAPTTSNASEDMSDLATAVEKPYCYWFIGGIDAEKWDKAEKEGRIAEDIPVNHSSLFAPVIQPTLRTGVESLCVAALAYLGRQQDS